MNVQPKHVHIIILNSEGNFFMKELFLQSWLYCQVLNFFLWVPQIIILWFLLYYDSFVQFQKLKVHPGDSIGMYTLQDSKEQGAYPAKNTKAQMPTYKVQCLPSIASKSRI
jgi:hypothetical protein